MSSLQGSVAFADATDKITRIPKYRFRNLGFVPSVLLFTLAYLIPTIWLAKYKLIWDDEFFTLYLSRLSSIHELFKALATGADQHPPPFYLITHFSMKLMGPSSLSLRMPAIAGYWLLCVCMYRILRPVTNRLWATLGMFLPLGSKIYYYATEARGYGLVAGLSALAVLCWFRATERRHRGAYLVGLGLSLAAVVSSHYYAATVPLSLAIGEAVRTWQRRKFDVPVWTALSFALVPLVGFLPIIRSARGYSAHFWAAPSWADAVVYYKTEFGSSLLPVLGIVCLFSLINFTSFTNYPRQLPAFHVDLEQWHVVAVIALSAIPGFVMLAAKTVTNGFSDRYAIPALVGVIVLVVYTLSRLISQRSVGIAALAVTVGLFAHQIFALHASFGVSRAQVTHDYKLLRDRIDGNQLPLVLMSITLFHQASFYTPREFASRLVYLCDPDSSVKYIQQDTIDRGLLDLNPWFPLRAVPAGTFVSQNSNFLAYGMTGGWQWTTYELPLYGTTRLLGRSDANLLFSVQDAHPARPFNSFDANFKTEQNLYRTLPNTGRSACEIYLDKNSCLQF